MPKQITKQHFHNTQMAHVKLPTLESTRDDSTEDHSR